LLAAPLGILRRCHKHRAASSKYYRRHRFGTVLITALGVLQTHQTHILKRLNPAQYAYSWQHLGWRVIYRPPSTTYRPVILETAVPCCSYLLHVAGVFTNNG